MISKANYGSMDWADALKAFKKPDDPARDLEAQNEADLIANALESTAKIAFNLPEKPETRQAALSRSSKEIADKHAETMKFAAANEIKGKLKDNGIDPIALGITVREANGKLRPITAEEWEGASDARWVGEIATAAALEYEHQAKIAWEKTAMQPSRKLSSTYDPQTMRDGRIMSCAGANEETRDRPRMMPANSASIFDPFKLDRFASTETEHDKSVAKIRADQKARIDQKKAAVAPAADLGPDPMKSGAIQRSGGQDRDVFQQRVPKNQISMLDLQGTEKLTAAEMKEKLASLFTRVDDNGAMIKQQNAEHKASITAKTEEKDRSWEKVAKPLSTAELSRRLMESFTCPKPPEDGR